MDKKLNKLYQSTILEHGHDPKNFGRLDKYDQFAEGFNPLCGDKINIYCKYNFNLKLEITFESVSCVICTASASLMTTELVGSSKGKAIALIDKVLDGLHSSTLDQKTLSKQINMLDGVKEFPSRIQCAALPWTTTRKAIIEPETRPE